MVVGATGLPDLPLTLFANELRRSLSQASIRVYVREVLSLANWASTDAVSRRNQWTLLDALRFLLHGSLTASDGSGIPLTSHLLRHAFATEMASLKVPIEVLAALLHQRDPTVTRYYSQPARTQVMDAAEMIFVDKIDVAAEALRNPEEIGRMLREAEGKIGALTEVIGGTCVLSFLRILTATIVPEELAIPK